jgi:hypothetical protein
MSVSMRTKLLNTIFSPIVMLILTILACNKPQASPSPDVAMVVAQTQTAIAVQKFLSTLTTTSQPMNTPSVSKAPSTQHPATSPAPTATIPVPQTCTDKAKFIDETIPDGSVFKPGESFVKTWTLVNSGTCTWTPDYGLVFFNGEQMDGTSPSPIGQAIPPNEKIQLFLPLTAPMNLGEYQGFWKLRNTHGQDFGLGENADIAFWVKIITLPVSDDNGGVSNLGQPTWNDSFDKSSNTFYLGKDSDISFNIEGGKLVMTAFEPAGDQWRVAELGSLDNFYLEAKFKIGSKCSGKDSYGLIIRAPDRKDGVIDTGFVFGFSCEGNYRVYRMDNGNYNGIQNWTGSTNIKSGPSQDNTMGIMAKVDTYQLFANGTKIFEFSDATYLQGLFGLMIRSEVTEDLQVSVKDIAYWILQ